MESEKNRPRLRKFRSSGIRQEITSLHEKLARQQEEIDALKQNGHENVFRTDRIEIITGHGNPELARATASILGKKADEPVIVFASGERTARLSDNCRKKHIFVMQSPTPPFLSDHVMELHSMIGAARRASAAEITAVVPFFPMARQDRKSRPREGIDAADQARILETLGVDRIMTVDIHADQAQGFTTVPWDNLFGSAVLLPAFLERGYEDVVVVSPDAGGAKRAEKISGLLPGDNDDIAVMYKRRDPTKQNESKALGLMGDVGGKTALIVDDMIDSGGSVADAARLLKDRGANKVVVMATHGLFSDKEKGGKPISALDTLNQAPIDEIFITNTLAQRPEVLANGQITIVGIESLLAEAIKRAHTGQSISELIPK